MGTQVFNGETETDAETIIQYTRKPKKAPAYIPRSRSLEDLPGGLRVPIIKKPESRLQQKHEANVAGLLELKLLRQKHGQMVDDLKTVSEMGPKKNSGNRLSSALSLASIKEEPLSPDSNENYLESQYSKPRFSIASNESQTFSIDNNDSVCNSLESLQDTVTESRTNEQISTNFETCGGVFNIQSNPPRRRASIQVDTRSNRLPPPVDGSIRPKLRRASFQCEAVLTKQLDREEPVSKVISDLKLKYDFPSPIHAITRQYGSHSDIRMHDQMADESPTSKDLKSILKEWQNENTKTTHTTPPTDVSSHNRHEKYNTESCSCSHSRNLSMTSDYFGSTETLNTVKTFPLQSRENKPILERRRQSLPANFTGNQTEQAPKLPKRRLSYTSKSNNESEKCELISKIERTNDKSRMLSTTESDDGVFNEDDEHLKSNKPNVRRNIFEKKSYNTSDFVGKLSLETAL